MLSQFHYEKSADRKDYIILTKYVPDSRYKKTLHFHNSVEFVFMLRGSCGLRISSEERTLTYGEIGYMNSFDAHLYTPDGDTDYYAVLIGAEFFDGINNLSNISFPSFMERSESFEVIKSFLDYSYENWDGSTPAFKQGFANMLLGLMTRYYPIHKKERDKQNEVIISALQYINESLCEDISVESVAKRFGYTPNYFSTVFNSFTNMSFREYLNRCRIAKFARLTNTDPGLPAYKAAELCGFRSLNTFYRAYNKYKE